MFTNQKSQGACWELCSQIISKSYPPMQWSNPEMKLPLLLPSDGGKRLVCAGNFDRGCLCTIQFDWPAMLSMFSLRNLPLLVIRQRPVGGVNLDRDL